MFRHYLNLPRAVYIICVGTFLNRCGSFVLLFMTPYLRGQLHFETSDATRTLAAYGAGSILAAVIGGQLADQIGRKTVMAGSLVGGSLILLVIPHLRSPWAIALTVMVFALVMDTYRPAASAMIADLVDAERRQHAFSLVYISINLGFCVAPLVGGYLAENSYLWLFVGDAITTATYAIVIITLLTETLKPRRADSAGETNAPKTAGQYSPLENETEYVPALKAAGMIIRDRVFVVFIAASLMLAIVYQQAITTLPLYLDSMGLGPGEYGKIIAINGLIIVLFQVPLTAVVARVNRRHALVAASLFIAAGFGLTAWALAPWQFMFTVAIWTIGEMMDAPLKFAVTTDLAPVALRARYMGVIAMTFSAGLMIGATGGGEILQRYGGTTLWITCSVLSVLAAIAYAAQGRRLDVRPHATTNDATPGTP